MGEVDVNDVYRELKTLKEKVRLIRAQGEPSLSDAGDYTYGTPEIKRWNDETRLYIGKFCSFADGVTIIMGGEHRVDWMTTYPFNDILPSCSYIEGHPATKGDIIIGNDVWIGMNSIITSGVSIGDGAVIGAGSVVTSSIEPYSISAGHPAKHIRYRFEKEIIDRLLIMKWWDWPDEVIAVCIPLLQSGNFSELWELYLGLKEDGVI